LSFETARNRLREHLRVDRWLHHGDVEVSLDTLQNLLQAVSDGHSLNSAARVSGKSWRHAWGAIRASSGILQVPLITSTIGGSGGGGSELTDAGRAVLKELRALGGALAEISDHPPPSAGSVQHEAPGHPVVPGPPAVPGLPVDSVPLVFIAATLESVETGLMEAVGRTFFEESGIRLGIVAAGSGTACRLAEQGRVDLVLTHAPDLERTLVERGVLETGLPLMLSRYVVVGPIEDPAGVTNAMRSADPLDAVRRIAVSERTFISRGDGSGTHLREEALWRAAGIRPAPPWHRRAAGTGNRAVLEEAAKTGAYALVDQATVRKWGLAPKQRVLYRDPADRTAELMEDRFSLFRARRGHHTAEESTYRHAGEFLSWFERRKKDLIPAAAVDSRGKALFLPWS
jgi:tungstate transport system substrate-binding protein